MDVKLGWRRGIKWVRVAVPYVLEYDQVAGFLRFSINTWALYCDLTFVLAFETGCYGESLFHLQTVTNEKNSRWIFSSLPSNAIFHWHNPSGRTVALGSTQPLTEMSTRNISWGERRPVRRADNLITFMCLNLLEPSGTVKACNWIALPFYRPMQIQVCCILFPTAGLTENSIVLPIYRTATAVKEMCKLWDVISIPFWAV
jgi:hypothetical protein